MARGVARTHADKVVALAKKNVLKHLDKASAIAEERLLIMETVEQQVEEIGAQINNPRIKPADFKQAVAKLKERQIDVKKKQKKFQEAMERIEKLKTAALAEMNDWREKIEKGQLNVPASRAKSTIVSGATTIASSGKWPANVDPFDSCQYHIWNTIYAGRIKRKRKKNV